MLRTRLISVGPWVPFNHPKDIREKAGGQVSGAPGHRRFGKSGPSCLALKPGAPSSVLAPSSDALCS